MNTCPEDAFVKGGAERQRERETETEKVKFSTQTFPKCHGKKRLL